MDILNLAVFNALNGNLSWDGDNVPVYDEKRRVNATDNIYVVLSTQQESDAPQTSDAFITLSTIDIEILHKTDYEVSKTVVNNISNQILNIIFPTPQTNGMPVQDHFQILNVRRERAITRQFALTDSQSILAKIITISCHIVQQSP